MKIMNITKADYKDRICYFDILLENDSFLITSARLIKTSDTTCSIGLTAPRRGNKNGIQLLDKEIEKKIMIEIIDLIPKVWIDDTEVFKLKNNSCSKQIIEISTKES